ncbi:MAG TPA: pitrilysin family protein [Candidatus Acidoferrales bacterium]|nr:pitrilysin family protein [Candidatus Acidoferrales bacterium]
MTRRELLAMAAASASAAEHLNRAPISREALTVKLPEAEPVKLANGVTLLAIEDNRLPIALVRFQVEGAGPVYSPRPGVAEMTAEMLREGAAGRSGKQIGDEAARLGATLRSSAQSGAETATVDGSGLTSRFSEWLDLLTSVALHPSFPADEFTSLRQRLIAGSRLRLTRPAAIASGTAQRLILGPHPASVDSVSPEGLAALTPEMLGAWHRERYTPAKMVVSCIGRVRPAAFSSQMEKLIGGWRAPEANVTLPPNPQPATARRIALVDRPGAQQTELVIGGLLFDRRDPDLFPMSVMDMVLGATSGSRLFRILRNEKRYVFNVQSVWAATRFPGFWQVRAGTRADATQDTIAIVLEQLQRLCNEPIPAAELESAKRAVIGNFALNLEQPATVLNQSYLRYRYGFSLDYWERYPAKINAVTAAEAQAVARKYLDPSRALIVAVGDAAKIRGALEKFGKVEAG